MAAGRGPRSLQFGLLTRCFNLSVRLCKAVLDCSGRCEPVLELKKEGQFFRLLLCAIADVEQKRAHGLSYHVTRLLVELHHAMHTQLVESAESVQQAAKALYTASSGFAQIGRTRYFLAEKPALPNQPLTSFISVSRNPALRRARSDRTKSELEFALAFKSTGVRIFEGRIEQLGKVPSVVTSVLPGIPIRFSNSSPRRHTAY